jgi:hypothetical protein
MLAPLALVLAAASKSSPSLFSKARGVARVTTYFGAMIALAATFTMHGAKAELAENQISLGRDLAPLADLLKEENTILVNGERAHVATATTHDSLETVLDRFSASCASNASPLSDAWKAVPERTRADARDAIAAVATTKQITNDEGTVACIARGANSKASFIDAARDFAKSGDFGSIGQLRYVYAKRGADGTTFVMTAWTDDSFSVRALTPQNGGDAAGDDSAIAPRPQHSQRILSAGVAGAPFAVRAYRTSDAPESILGFYETSMQASGWSCVSPDGLAPAMRTCSKDGTQVSIVTRATEDGQTMVSVSEVRS